MCKDALLFKRDRPIFSPRRKTTALLLAAGVGTLVIAGVWLAYSGGWHEVDSQLANGIPVSISRQLGIEALTASLQLATPTGKGIVTGHVESRVEGAYLPAVDASRFSGVTFQARSGASKISGHASATATIIYGPKGLAPGITQVPCFATDHWLGHGFLNAFSDQEPLVADPIRLFTCSWVSYDLHPASDILLRIDQVVDEQGVIVVAAVNNGRATTVPPILGSAYNVITVGDWDGDSSGGYTTDDIKGRSKPDLVGPGGLTSFATPGVGAMAARLMETADRMHIERSIQPAVIKAVLMAGADKPAGWARQAGRVLDDHLGAGRPRLDYSHDMLTHPLTPNAIPLDAGWDSRTIEPFQDMNYRLLVHEPAASFSAVLTWHRRVDSSVGVQAMGRQLRRTYQGRMAHMTLKLLRSDLPTYQTIDVSMSEIDNVQHVYATKLPAGRYDLIVNRPDGLDETWTYALAWRVAYEPSDSSDSSEGDASNASSDH